MKHKNKYKILCPKCGKYGFLTKRWVESSYYPKYVSVYLLGPHQREEVTGSKYRGDTTKDTADYSGIEEEIDKESFYRVSYGRYTGNYIGHYSSQIYYQQMQDYKMHKRKSRPNGRKWCYLSSSIICRQYNMNEDNYYVTCCLVNYDR